MGGKFNSRGNYHSFPNVRDFDDLLRPLRDPKVFPQGAFWPLVGTRRAGKTWALCAIEDALDREMVKRVELRDDDLPRRLGRNILLIDEPGAALERDPGGFVERCDALKNRPIGPVKILVAMSPGEWAGLVALNLPPKYFYPKDVCYLHPLRPAEQQRLRDAAIAREVWAGPVLDALLADWRRQPFLQLLVLEIAEKYPEWRDKPSELLREAIEESFRSEHEYFPWVFGQGLVEEQRDFIRLAAHGRVGNAPLSPVQQLLCRCGLLEQQGLTCRVADPILAANLPPPLRIHHVSDLHIGDPHTKQDKSAYSGDVKETGSIGKKLGAGMGHKPVRDNYLEHVKTLPEHEKPHLIIVSGDVAELGRRDLYERAAEWFRTVADCLGNHPDLSDQPRVLLVGGNHDVDWGAVDGADGLRKRHLAFAEAFAGYVRPQLELPPDQRPLATVDYGQALGVEILLLGSSEFGGEKDEDDVWQRLVQLVTEYRAKAMDGATADEIGKRVEDYSRIDPGLVHQQDIYRARAHNWRRPVRIAVLHHPVSAMPPAELARFSGLINAGQVKSLLLDKGFCLVLHGHLHAGWFGVEEWPELYPGCRLHIAAAPTLSSRETQHGLGYNCIEIVREGTKITLTVCRHVNDGGAAWHAGPRLGPFSPRNYDR
jgi:predicted MPP superfamily phosphohydrolase